MIVANYPPKRVFYKFDDLISYLDKKEFSPFDHWVFRGQDASYDLETSLEYECKKSSISLNDAPDIEREMISTFQRIYDGDYGDDVRNDTLFCLTLMRHYGAPTRLIDFTYSKYVAVYFAIKCAYNKVPSKVTHSSGKEYLEPDYVANRKCSLWCINTKSLRDKFKDKYEGIAKLIEDRYRHVKRNDKSFKALYLSNRYQIALVDSSMLQHQRIHIQQGTVLCTGDVKQSFMNNLGYTNGGEIEGVVKLDCSLNSTELERSFDKLMRMNITDESLFPGLDGLSELMKYHIQFYKKVSVERK